MNKYSYDELKGKALGADATKADINELGKWFWLYGSQFWNGEVYDIDGAHSLKPIYAFWLVRDREAGNEIEYCQTEEDAIATIKQFEGLDLLEGTYEPDFYEAVELDEPELLRYEII